MADVGKLKEEDSVLIVIDVQEKFKLVIHGWDGTLVNIVKLVRGCQILDIPVIVTEQYPKGLGRTVQEIRDALDFNPVEKMSFSCFGEEGFKRKLEGFGRKTLVLCGVEAHVCLLNTTLDALEKGYKVHYVVDAVSSRNPTDKEIAVKRVIHAGAYPTSTEMILFQLLEKAGTEEFKEISKIVK
ncbi:MAG: hydrolase [Candidatus Altiarchaeota archaeon]